jgi:hypothetical protein
MKTKGVKRMRSGKKSKTMKRNLRMSKYFIGENANDAIRKSIGSNVKRGDALSKVERELVLLFLTLLNIIKLYHWNTYSYGEHKATDELYERMNGHIDKFMEILLGKETMLHPTSGRLDISNLNIKVPEIYTREQMADYLNMFKDYLITLGEKDELEVIYAGDLFNVRDEIVGDLNQFLYLLTLQ